MANDVKWIKITTDIFDDEKILMIETMPGADSIIVIWFKLLTFSGKQNNDGVFMMNNRIAYTDEMLAAIFRRDINIVRLALKTFEEFGMIEVIENVITIPNWNKHQTLDAYEQKKERDRLYQAKRRAAQRALITESSDSKTTESSDVAISEEDKERDKEKEYHSFNQSAFSVDEMDDIQADPGDRERSKRRFLGGTLGKGVVLLSDEQMDNLLDVLSAEEFEHYVSVIAAKELQGHHYKRKTHYQAIMDMATKDRKI